MPPWPKSEKIGLFTTHAVLGSVDEACELIVSISEKWADFWPQSHGWAPTCAAELMKSELMDRQVEMARALREWPQKLSKNDSQGQLILAWTNLGSVIEGVLKVYMCVFYADWMNEDHPSLQKIKTKSPDDTFLEKLIIFVEKKDLFNSEEIHFFRKIREQRNLIHPFKGGTVMDKISFNEAVLTTAALHYDVEMRLPDPYQW